jgi:protein-S-isoprenylcysteine O-methyltransferase Ste14
MEKVRRAAIGYYLLQGVAVAGWWLMMYLQPSTQGWFRLDPNSPVPLNSFWLGDLLFIAPGSLAAAFLLYVRWKYATAVMWLVTGAISQATFYTAAYSFQSDLGWLGVALMLPAMIWSGVFATGVTFGGEMFRRAKATSTNYILLKTFAQIAVVWTLILVVFPYIVTLLEDKLGITRLQFPFQKPLSVILFLAISTVGVSAAIVMSRIGKGTPLPLDHATDLVVVGPYRYVRNPMALSGIGQGLAVALFLGSPLVAIYALMGSAIWQFIFRPLEEDDLEHRFGQPFTEYKRSVRCWIPRSSPFSGGKPPFLTETDKLDSV